jgi:hypothetical protein
MSTLLVTAMYDLYQDPEFKISPETAGWSNRWLSIEFRMRHLEKLLDSDAEILLFVQPDIAPFVNNQNPKIRVISLDLEELITYNQVLSKKDLILPYHRNMIKDKIEYFGLMNSKTDFMIKAKDLYPDFDHYAWIDGSIFKLFKDSQTIQQFVADIANRHLPDNIISPRGDQLPLYALDAIWIEQVLWRSLGSVLIVPSHMLREFQQTCDLLLKKLMDRGRITWEINVWAKAESLYMRPFVTYRASHDESLLKLPAEINPREYGEPNVIK